MFPCEKKAEIDLKKHHGAFTMDVIARCAFATKTNTHKDPNNPFVENASAFFQQKLWQIISGKLKHGTGLLCRPGAYQCAI